MGIYRSFLAISAHPQMRGGAQGPERFLREAQAARQQDHWAIVLAIVDRIERGRD